MVFQKKFLYKITNLINGKIYIGQTIHPEKRWWEHKNRAKNNYDNFINLLDKFPIDTFSTYKFKKPKITTQQIKDLNNKINELKTNIFLENEDGSLFSCYVDFEKKLIYPTFNDKKHGIDFDKINNISDFWNSEKFVEVRNSLIDSKYEKEN